MLSRILCLPLIVLALCGPSAHADSAGPRRVLVVMSYEEAYAWERDIRRGIEEVLGSCCDRQYLYLDTKHNFAAGHTKAKEALALFKRYKPHGIIAADDNAQSFFVVPYLRNRVDTPIIFCGVNASPDTYGYPAQNVSGVLERQHFRETIAFAQMLIPGIRTVGFIMRNTPTTDALLQQIEKEKTSYPARILPSVSIQTLREAEAEIDRLSAACDALILNNLNGLRDASGLPMREEAAFRHLMQRSSKVFLGVIPDHVRYGVLLTVASSGVEQGTLAAEMLLKCMAGTPVNGLPVTRNRLGQRIVNLKTMRALGIKPIPAALVGATLYEGE